MCHRLCCIKIKCLSPKTCGRDNKKVCSVCRRVIDSRGQIQLAVIRFALDADKINVLIEIDKRSERVGFFYIHSSQTVEFTKKRTNSFGIR